MGSLLLDASQVPGQTCRFFFDYQWRQPVYYPLNPTMKGFLTSKDQIQLGLWMGPNMNTGGILTYDILDLKTEKIVTRSVIRPADDPHHQNFRANAYALPKNGENNPDPERTDKTVSEIIMSFNDLNACAHAS